MKPNCILDPAANLLIRHMTCLGNVEKSLTTSHLKDLDSSFKFCYNDLAFTGR